MKAIISSLTAALSLWLMTGFSSKAAVLYVNAGGTDPVSPYSSWATAATNIQDAVDAANAGDEVLVTNGVYQYGGHKASISDVTNRVTVTNVVTVQSVNGPAVTIIQGYQPVGASNANNAVRCAFFESGGVLAGFTLTGGQAGTGNNISGGGFLGGFNGVAGVASNCVMTGNIATNGGGGGAGASRAILVNCVLANNQAGFGAGAAQSTLVNCTVVSNAALDYGGGVYQCTSENSVIYFNTAGAAGSNYYAGTLNYCCTSPLPGGTGNSTTAPGFVNFAAGNFHLQIGSPCIDIGDNAYVTASTDLDGNPRIVNGTVDLGAYESQYAGPVHYVSLTSTNPVPPYTNWSTAATNIQDAIGAAQAGEIVLASNGNYNIGGIVLSGTETNRVAVTNPVTVLSYSGPQSAIITGRTQMRCAYVGTNAVLSGFTLTGGYANGSGGVTNADSGGGTWCEASGVVTNCVFAGNTGLNGYGGGDYGGTVWNSVLSNNTASYGGGGAYASLINCTIITNLAEGNYGGGAYAAVVSNCMIISNWAYSGGGGAYLSELYNSTLASNISSLGTGGAGNSTSYNCSFTGNHGGGGGGTQNGTNFGCIITQNSGFYGGGTYDSTNYNCVLKANSAGQDGGGAFGGNLYNCIVESNSGILGGGIYLANAVNCTIVSNVASNTGGGAAGGALYNCIIYYNTAPTGSNWSGSSPIYCCTVPPGSPAGDFRCFSNPPVFVNLASGDLHQQTNSPTINGGLNSYVTSPQFIPAPLTNDFDGNPRTVGGTVDVGAYEYQGPNSSVSLIPIPWLILYQLPTDGSDDYLDTDGSGMNNWQEWIAGTIPNNPATVLKMLQPSASGTNLVVTWQSVTNRSYYLQRANGQDAQPTFSPLVSNIVGLAGTTSYTDTNAPAPGPYFYRIGVNSQ